MTENMMTLKELIGRRAVLSIDGLKPVREAIKTLDACQRHAVGVMLEGAFAGVFSYTDFIQRVMMKGRHPGETLIIEVTTMDPVTISPGQSVQDAFELMSRHKYSHLPVLSADRKLMGIVSHDDLREEIARSLRGRAQEAEYLKSYIYGENHADKKAL